MRRIYSPKTIETIRLLYRQGYGQRRIGRELGMPWQSTWPFVCDIKKENRLCLPDRGVVLPIPDSARLMSAAKARIIGYLMGDGCVMSIVKKSYNRSREKVYSYSGSFMGFYNKELSVIDRFILDCKEVYGVSLKYNSNKLEVRLYRNEIFADLSRYGEYGTFDWRIPCEILNGSTVFKQEWIKAFCDSEATVDGSGRKIVIYSANKVGLLQLKGLFSEFGLYSYLTGPYAGAFRLNVAGRGNLRRFSEFFNFYHIGKRERLNGVLASFKRSVSA